MYGFPFLRGQKYPFAELLKFEEELSNARRVDSSLSAQLREPTNSKYWWIKLRHEELVPLIYCLNHGKFNVGAEFLIKPANDRLDLQVYDMGQVTDLQFTVADAKWKNSKKGSQHHLQVEAAKNGKCISGIGPYEYVNGELKGRAGALSNEERDHAFGVGLTEALKRKIGKVELSTVLVIFCRKYGEAMDSSSFNEIIRSAIGSSTLNSFGRVWFVDYQEGFFAEHFKD